MKNLIAVLLAHIWVASATARPHQSESYMPINNNIVVLSQELLYASKTKEPTDSLLQEVKNITETMLKEQLTNDNQKKAFWINIYNGVTQVRFNQQPRKIHQPW